jgi:hypothetical protein
MKKVFQTKFGQLTGNCMNACLASLLELDIELIPAFGHDKKWWTRMREFLGALGYSPLEIEWNEGHDGVKTIFPNTGQIAWGVGKSPRGDWNHAALFKYTGGGWELIHDPYPGGGGFDGPIKQIGFLVPKETKPYTAMDSLAVKIG